MSREFTGCITAEQFTTPQHIYAVGRNFAAVTPSRSLLTVDIDGLGIRTIISDGEKAEKTSDSFDPGDSVTLRVTYGGWNDAAVEEAVSRTVKSDKWLLGTYSELPSVTMALAGKEKCR